MSTRINRELWGYESSWQYAGGSNPTNALKVSNRVYTDIIAANAQLLNEPYDTSVCVWGVPADSSAGSISTVSWWGGSSKTYDFEWLTPKRYNIVPTTIFYASGGANYYAVNRPDYITRNIYGTRIVPDVELVDQSGTYTHTPYPDIPYSKRFKTVTPNATTTDNIYNSHEQVVFYDYSKWVYMTRVSFAVKQNADIDAKIYGGSDMENVFNVRWDDVKISKNLTDEDIVITGAALVPWYYGGGSGRTTRAAGNPIISPLCDCIPSSRTAAIMFDNPPDSGIHCGNFNMAVGTSATNDNYQQATLFSSATVAPTESTYFDGKTSEYYGGKNMIVSCDNMYKCSNKRYEFDDVSYHWSLGIMYNYQIYDIADNNIWTYTLSSVYIGNMNIVPYLVIDDDKGAGYKVACEKAIKHEVAFFGVPFTTSQNKAIYSDIDSSDIFLPLFDEHITTTGEYKTGAQAKADGEVNAAWKDVFSDDSIINNYDPEYQPEPINPEPEQHDQGDLQNTTKNRYSNAGGLKQYVVTQDTVIKLTAFLNGTYLPTEADLTADFKGTNPQDYVVSVQKYPFDLPYESGDAPIYIGKIPSGLTGKILSRSGSSLAPLPINGVSTFDFGTLSLTKNNYNDFRDFQSKILLFLPFIGTIELDPRLYMYHSVNLIYTIDYNTGCVNAEIKRDGLTTETKGGTISITIPFFAANMGQYQNQLAQLDYAKQMTKIKGIQTALSTGFQIGSAALGMSNTGTTPSMGQLSAISQGGVSLAQNATQLSQIDYQIEHTAPSIGTLSTASAANAFFMDPRARLVIVRPMMLRNYDRAQYARTIGHACCKTATLSKFNGYTVAATAVLDNVHTKISNRQATEQEKQILRRALQNGIYI